MSLVATSGLCRHVRPQRPLVAALVVDRHRGLQWVFRHWFLGAIRGTGGGLWRSSIPGGRGQQHIHQHDSRPEAHPRCNANISARQALGASSPACRALHARIRRLHATGRVAALRPKASEGMLRHWRLARVARQGEQRHARLVGPGGGPGCAPGEERVASASARPRMVHEHSP